MKVLLDSNVLISALYYEGNERRVLVLIAEGIVFGVISEYVLDEVTRTIDEKFASKTPEMLGYELLGLALKNSDYVTKDEAAHLVESAESLIRDEKDAPVLAAALASSADVLVSGDRDFFALKKPVRFKVLTARGFLELYSKTIKK